MGKLSGYYIYLCGPVEHDPDCKAWRTELRSNILDINNEIIVWDPTIRKPPFEEDAFEWASPNESANSIKSNKYVRKICTSLAGQCDIIIAMLNRTFTWGSIHELEIAIYRNIPIYLWMANSHVSVYGSAGIITDESLINNYIHSSKESLLSELRKVNDGTTDIASKDPLKWLKSTWPKDGA